MQRQNRKLYRNYLIAILSTLSLLILTAGYFYLDHQREIIRKEKEQYLQSIVSTKIKAVDNWFIKIESFCRQLSENKIINHHIKNFLIKPSSEERALIEQIIVTSEEHVGIKSILLCNGDKKKILSQENKGDFITSEVYTFCKKADDEKQIIFSDFYLNSITKKPQISFHVPIFKDSTKQKTIGVINLVFDPSDYLYPLISEWPVKTHSGEAFISSRRGNEIIYLTQLKFNRNAAFQFSLPDTLKDLPAYMGANNIEGIIEGRDYRGVEVLAAVKNLDKTDWSIVAKEDIEEIFAESDKYIVLLTVLFVGIIPIAGLILAFVWNAREKDVLKKLVAAEKEVETATQQLSSITKYANDIILLLDTDGKIIQANERAISTYGYKKEELLSMDIKHILAHDERQFIQNRMNRILNSDEGYLIESAHLKKNGTIFPVEVSARRLVFKNEVYIQTIIRDITERKNAEAELRKREEQYKELFDSTTDLIHILSPDGKILYANPAWHKLLGYTKEDIINLTIDKIIHPDSLLQCQNVIQQVIDGETLSNVPNRFIAKDGSFIDAEGNITCQYDAGEPKRITCFLRDVTDKKKAEQELKRSSEKLSTIFSAMDDLIFILNYEGTFLEIAPTGYKQLYRPIDEVLGKTVFDIFPESYAKFFYEKINEAITLQNRVDINYSLPINDSERWFDAKISPIDDKNVVIVISDVTDKKRAEMESELQQSISIAINKAEDFNEAVAELIKDVCVKTGWVYGEAWVPDFDTGKLHCMQAHYTSDEKCRLFRERTLQFSFNFGEGLPGRVWATQVPEWINDISKSENFPRIAVAGECSISAGVGIPICTKNNFVAVLCFFLFDRKEEDVHFTKLIHAVASQLGTLFLRKQVEDELKRSQLLLSSIYNASRDATILEDEHGLIAYANNATAILYGYETANELIGRDVSIIQFEEDVERLVKFRNMRLRGEEAPSLYEMKGKRKDGSFVEIENSVSVATVGDHHYIISNVRDISERKKTETEILKLNRALEQSSVSITITDYDGNIEYVNPFFTELTGYTFVEVRGKNPRFLKAGEYLTDNYKNLWSTIRSGNIWRGEFFSKKKNGETYWVLAVISPIVNKEGKITHFVAIEEDITEKKKMFEELLIAKDKAEEMNRVKSYFFANMSHELRTPLIGILGFAEMLRDSIESDEELKSMAEIILTSGNRLLNTLNLILNLSKLEATQPELKIGKHNIIPKLKNIFQTYSKLAERSGLEYKFITETPDIFCSIDEKFFNNIFDNLVNNAIKYTTHGSVTIKTSVANEVAVIQVIDTGIGIDKDKQDLVWYEFRQASEGLNRSFEGTGLGLTIAKKYTEAMSGKISLESEPGKGTIFTVEFPISKIDSPSEVLTVSNEISSSVVTGSNVSEKKILLVEDDPIAVEVISLILTKGYKIDHVFSGEDALVKVQEKNYDAILMDINLRRGIDGIITTKEIRKMKNYKAIPIIAVTAYAMEEERKEFLSKGMTHYISKPFSKNDLQKLMKEVFQE